MLLPGSYLSRWRKVTSELKFLGLSHGKRGRRLVAVDRRADEGVLSTQGGLRIMDKQTLQRCSASLRGQIDREVKPHSPRPEGGRILHR